MPLLETLYIKEGAICVISTFAVKLENVTTEEITRALHPGETSPRSRGLFEIVTRCKGGQPSREKTNKTELCSCCQSGDDFHNRVGHGDSYYCERFHVKSFSLKRAETPKALEVDVILSVFKNLNLAHLEFNIPVEEVTDTEFVFLQHRFYEGATPQFNECKKAETDILLTRPEERVEMEDYPGVLQDLCGQLLDEIRRNMARQRSKMKRQESGKGNTTFSNTIVEDSSFVSPLIFYYFIAEIRDIESWNDTGTNFPVETIIQQHGRSLYGILTSDEGFAFVPQDLVAERLKNKWGSRTFSTCFVFGKSALSLNFKNSSNAGRQYMQMEQARMNCTSIRRNYFSMSPCIAGLDHGILTCTERSIILLFELKYASVLLSGDIPSNQISAIAQLHQKRQNIIHLLNESQQVISEVNELFLLISRENKVLDIFEEIKFQLDFRTEDLSFSYQKNNDMSIKLLTIVTTIISILAITSETMINREQVMFFPGLKESSLVYYVVHMFYYTFILTILMCPFVLIFFILQREKVKKIMTKLQRHWKNTRENK